MHIIPYNDPFKEQTPPETVYNLNENILRSVNNIARRVEIAQLPPGIRREVETRTVVNEVDEEDETDETDEEDEVESCDECGATSNTFTSGYNADSFRDIYEMFDIDGDRLCRACFIDAAGCEPCFSCKKEK